jgi:hypothetical protein
MAYHGRRGRLPRHDAATASAVATTPWPASATAAPTPRTGCATVVGILRAGGGPVCRLAGTVWGSTSHVATAPAHGLQDAEPFVADLRVAVY